MLKAVRPMRASLWRRRKLNLCNLNNYDREIFFERLIAYFIISAPYCGIQTAACSSLTVGISFTILRQVFAQFPSTHPGPNFDLLHLVLQICEVTLVATRIRPPFVNIPNFETIQPLALPVIFFYFTNYFVDKFTVYRLVYVYFEGWL